MLVPKYFIILDASVNEISLISLSGGSLLVLVPDHCTEFMYSF